MPGPRRAQPADLLLVLERGVAALHRREDAVGAATAPAGAGSDASFGTLRVGLDQAVAELDRMRGREADAADAVDARDVLDQQREVRASRRRAIGPRYALTFWPEQVDLAHALRGERRDLGQHVVERARLTSSPRVYGTTQKRAVLAAAFHDRDERARSVHARLGQVVELLDLGKADVDLRRVRRRARRRCICGRRCSVCGPNTRSTYGARATIAAPSWLATQPPTPITSAGLACLSVFQSAELREHLFLRLLADRAGVDQDDVGLGLVARSSSSPCAAASTSAILAESYSFIWQPWVLMIELAGTSSVVSKIKGLRGGECNAQRACDGNWSTSGTVPMNRSLAACIELASCGQKLVAMSHRRARSASFSGRSRVLAWLAVAGRAAGRRAAGGIRQYTDAKGVMHYTNVAGRPADAPAPSPSSRSTPTRRQRAIYKFTDAVGVTHYTDRSPRSGRAYIVVSIFCPACDPKSTVNWNTHAPQPDGLPQRDRTAARANGVDPALVRALDPRRVGVQPARRCRTRARRA